MLFCVLLAVVVDRACSGAGAPAARAVSAAGPARGAADAGPAYAAGACQAQAPTGRSRGQTVFIDAGHGGPDPGVLGPAGSTTRESRAALAVAIQLSGKLRADGYRVVLSRTGDTSVQRFAAGDLTAGTLGPEQVHEDLQARVRCANDSHAAALLSIHFNGYMDPAAGGSQTIYDDVRPFADRSRRLAVSVQQALVGQVRLADRGVITDDALDAPTLSDRAESYGHLLLLGPAQPGWLARGSVMPGALVEPLFLTRPAEASLASSAAGQGRIAQALAAGLERYLSTTP